MSKVDFIKKIALGAGKGLKKATSLEGLGAAVVVGGGAWAGKKVLHGIQEQARAPERTMQQLALMEMMEQVGRVQRQRQQRLKEMVGQNMYRAAMFAPEMTASILAGRRLPEDAVALGGRQRVDLLQQVAEQMAANPTPSGAMTMMDF